MALEATLYLILTRIFVGLYLKSPLSFGWFKKKKNWFSVFTQYNPRIRTSSSVRRRKKAAELRDD